MIYFNSIASCSVPFMPTLLDYQGVSLIQNKSPGLLYSLPNLLDKSKFGFFFFFKKSPKLLKKILGFLFLNGCIFLKFNPISAYISVTSSLWGWGGGGLTGSKHDKVVN